MPHYRDLQKEEIKILMQQGCIAKDWNEIQVVDNFSPLHICNVCFEENIKLGSFKKIHTFIGGITKPSGIANATLHNVEIGNDVYIHNIRNYIANYIIEDEVEIANTNILVTDKKSSFGNGVEVSVLNETGGRDVLIYDHLSSHIAYILALYKHDVKACNTIQKHIKQYAEKIASDKGIIGKGSKIFNCHTLKNIKTGEYAFLENAHKLLNGTINSSELFPSFVGDGVMAENFILAKGSKLTDGAIVDKCFVGEGTTLGKQYSAENCLFFANCIGFHGEACSIFAGPYTVTHHKSTLLIAGYFSFLNAGSGSNQSNHLYKLGPIHQGVIERGSKTASDSYILWPAKVGAFSLILGRHHTHADTSDFPFSYLIEKQDTTFLSPAANLTSVGTIRDAKKWEKRDLRKGTHFLDYIIFDLFTPYTIAKIIRGLHILKTLQQISGVNSQIYSYQSALIKNHHLKNGIIVYEAAINKFVGDAIVKKLQGNYFSHRDDVIKKLKPTSNIGIGEWIDVAGLIMPKSKMTTILENIEILDSLDKLQEQFYEHYCQFETYQYHWILDMWCNTILKKPFEYLQVQDIIHCIEKWVESIAYLDKKLAIDAKKEFTLEKMTSFGIDGDEQEKQEEFKQVRGDFENNSFIKELKEHQQQKNNAAHELILRLKPLV